MYLNHTEDPYSIADDTLIIQNELIINRSGFQKNAQRSALTYTTHVKQWKRNSPDAPVIRIDGKHAYWNNTIYLQMP